MPDITATTRSQTHFSAGSYRPSRRKQQGLPTDGRASMTATPSSATGNPALPTVADEPGGDEPGGLYVLQSPSYIVSVMRYILAGLFVMCLSSIALAQAEGEVESVGFQGYYRSNCWTPMVVRLRPKTGQSLTLQLQVVQKDLDSDTQTFTKSITLTQNIEGQATNEQRFWMYFIPQPTDNGLPDKSRGGTLKELQDQLQVYLCTDKGKQSMALPLTQMLDRVDVLPGSSMWSQGRGQKLILTVTDGSSRAAWEDYAKARGLVEDVLMVAVRPRELPEDVRGYAAVDAIVWLNATPPDPAKATDEARLRAIQEYVRQGGRLVICQAAEWRKTLVFGDLLPVNILEMRDKADLEPLKTLAKASSAALDPWNAATGPFKVARAQARPGTLIAEWIDWAEKAAEEGSDPALPATIPAAPTSGPDPVSAPDRSPYLVRSAYGLGAVTWVAQDLGDPSIVRQVKGGWPYVWDRVFDWRNATLVPPANWPQEDRRLLPYAPANSARDLGGSLISAMEHQSRGAGLVLLAVLFFIAYWVVAGPGSYLFLANRKRSGLSWFVFGASALAATSVTVLLVKLVLGGPPEVKHLSIVRLAPGQPAVVDSRIGLYIPSDGYKKVELKDTVRGAVSDVTAFAAHPSHLKGDTEFPAQQTYTVPIEDATSDKPVVVEFPYRSTLKKLQAHWVGSLKGGIEGAAKLTVEGTEIAGMLTNGTGQELREVHFVFNSPRAPQAGMDRVFYLPSWGPGVSIDLRKEFDSGRTAVIGTGGGLFALPGERDGRPIQGVIEQTDKGLEGALASREGWVGYWYSVLKGGTDDHEYSDAPEYRRSFPVMSLFDRLPPSRNTAKNTSGQYNSDRFELQRRGGRGLDMSQTVTAGQLLVLAQAHGPLPIPMEVEGQKVIGDGTILYQCVVPLDRTAAENPTTRPEKE